jgi:hypothetical protein
VLDGNLHLTLMIGPGVPLPVTRDILDALVRLQVNAETTGPSGFELVFNLSPRSPLHTLFLLSGGAPIPLVRVVVVVTVRGTPEVLVDGVMTNHEVTRGAEPGMAQLTVKGVDLTAVMDYLPLDGIPYPAMPPEARVLLILAKYAIFGVIPMVIPVILPDIPIPTEQIPMHQGTDLQYVRQLAEDAGYVFYISPGPAPGTSIAYWGPEIRVGPAQPALNVNMDAHTNVESLSFNFDTESRTLPFFFIQEPNSKVPIPLPVPDISLLNPPLGLVPPLPKKLEHLRETAKLTPSQALLRALGRAGRSADAVTGSGSLNVVRYGRVLKTRQLVGVRGVGTAFDGLYYVNRVTHKIQRGEYKQEFELSRNGLISTVAEVPV